jgi:hypothetical protein
MMTRKIAKIAGKSLKLVVYYMIQSIKPLRFLLKKNKKSKNNKKSISNIQKHNYKNMNNSKKEFKLILIFWKIQNGIVVQCTHLIL